MKIFTLTSALTIAASSAFAGPLAFETAELPGTIAADAGAMGGSGLWLIPLLVFALVFLTANGSDGRKRPPIKCKSIGC